MQNKSFSFPRLLVLLSGITLFLFGWLADWTHLLKWFGLADELHSARVSGDLTILRVFALASFVLLMSGPIVLWYYPQVIQNLSKGVKSSLSRLSQSPSFTSLFLVVLVLAKTVLQLGIYISGYTAYSADDFGRTFKADHWLQHYMSDLRWQEWLSLGSPWLPFPDYIFGAALALHRDLFFTPRVLNLVLSAISVTVVYFLGRELFGRSTGLLTAALWAFLPWHVWLGISGMTTDLPSVIMIGLSGFLLLRWLKTGRYAPLLIAASCLFLADGMRYENWLLSVVFCCLVALHTLLNWRQHTLPWPFYFQASAVIVIASAFPIIYTTASYLTLGNWIPALTRNASYVAAESVVPNKINLLILALISFPLEFALVLAGVLCFMKAPSDKVARLYLLFVSASVLLFVAVFKGSLPRYGAGVSRVLLPYALLLLPYAAYLLVQLIRNTNALRNTGAMLACLLFGILQAFNLVRACNYRDTFPKEAIYAGWTIRRLQDLGQIPENGKILLEKNRGKHYGHLGIRALANKPERFVLLDEDPAAAPCAHGFQTEVCKDTLRNGGFHLVILNSDERVSNFQKAFGDCHSAEVGRYHLFKGCMFLTHPKPFEIDTQVCN